MPKNDELPRGVLWSRFLETFAMALGDGAEVLRPRRIVAWRDGVALNRLHLLRWSWPDPGDRHAPRVTRIGLNTQLFRPPKTLLKRLGFDPLTRPDGDRALRLEWTVLGDELLAFADWLPLWMRGRLDTATPIPLPPHPSHVFGQDLRTTAYAWTVAAWDAYSRWKGQDPRLPWYAIHARDVVPSAAGQPA